MKNHALAYDWSFPYQDWQAKIAFEIRQSRYIIKTAQTLDEFRQVIELRSAVFLQEFAGKENAGLDIEARDFASDFLIIQDARSLEVLASYRLICSEFSNDFYSKTEFQLDDFLEHPGRKLELSRACVRADKRSAGIFVHLLWKGLGEYIRRSGSRYLFGCSSIQILDLRHLVRTYRYLQQVDALSHGFAIRPQPAYNIIDAAGILALKATDRALADSLPPLLLAYLNAGAKIYGTPAFDQDFGCLDLFTILDFEEMSSIHMRKYFLQPDAVS